MCEYGSEAVENCIIEEILTLLFYSRAKIKIIKEEDGRDDGIV
jgi:hypothetical protein